MPEPKAPGVYLEETSFRARSIEGVPSSTAGFAGLTRSGPARGLPRPVTSFTEFERVYGGLELLTVGKHPRLPYVAHAARAFFLNGGQRLYVAPIDVRMRIADFARALAVLTDIEEVEVVALPDSGDLGGEAASRKAARELVAHVERHRHRIAVLDPPVGSSTAEVRAFRAQFDSSHAALYYPWVAVADPSGTVLRSKARQRLLLPPCGFVSGVYARGDVAKGPAGGIVGAIGFERTIAKAEADVLNPDAINVLRTVVGRGSALSARVRSAPMRSGSTSASDAFSASWSARSSRARNGSSSSRTTNGCGTTCAARSRTSCSCSGERGRCREQSPRRRTSSAATGRR